MSHITCIRCGLINRASAEMCQQCGTELVSTETPAGSTGPATGYTPPEPLRDVANAVSAEHVPALDIGPFHSVGAVLSPTLSVFKNNIWLITKIVLIVFAPYEIVKALSLKETGVSWQAIGVIFFLGVVCKTLAAPALFYALLRRLSTGVAPGLNEAYQWGFSRLGRIVPASFLAWVLIALGSICLIIPGLILGAAFEPVGPIATLEEHSPVDVLRRSYHLTKGYRLRIFGAGFIISLLISVVSAPIGLLAGMIGGGTKFWLVSAVSSMLVDVVTSATIILSLMIYLSLTSNAQEAQEQSGLHPL